MKDEKGIITEEALLNSIDRLNVNSDYGIICLDTGRHHGIPWCKGRINVIQPPLTSRDDERYKLFKENKLPKNIATSIEFTTICIASSICRQNNIDLNENMSLDQAIDILIKFEYKYPRKVGKSIYKGEDD